MLAFTFPGQGSQRPGMGRPWADHDSWELVDEASEVAERDVARLLLDADADELKRHPQRPAHHVRVEPDRARCRRAPRHRAELLRRPQPRRVHRPHRHRRARLRRGRAPRRRARRRHAPGRASSNPGTMAAVLGLDDDLVEVACRRADDDVWVANFNAPGQVVIAGSTEGVAAAGVVAKELGAKKVMPLPVSGAFHTPFMAPGARPAAQGHRRGQPARHRGAGRSPTSTPWPTTQGAEWASLLSAQLSSPVRWKHCLLDAGRARASPTFVELGPGGVLTGMAKRTVDDARTISVATPDDLDKLLEWVDAGRHASAAPARGRAPVRRRAPRRQPGGRRVHPDRRPRRRHAIDGRHRARPRRRAPRCARRSPVCCRATSPSPASGSHRASRSPGCGRH